MKGGMIMYSMNPHERKDVSIDFHNSRRRDRLKPSVPESKMLKDVLELQQQCCTRAAMVLGDAVLFLNFTANKKWCVVPQDSC